MKNSNSDEQKAIDEANEKEYQRSLKETEGKSENKSSKANRGDVTEEGFTDGQGNYIATQNDILTEAQEAQTKEGNWTPYKKFSDGSYDFAAPKQAAAPVEEEEQNGKSKKK